MHKTMLSEMGVVLDILHLFSDSSAAKSFCHSEASGKCDTLRSRNSGYKQP